MYSTFWQCPTAVRLCRSYFARPTGQIFFWIWENLSKEKETGSIAYTFDLVEAVGCGADQYDDTEYPSENDVFLAWITYAARRDPVGLWYLVRGEASRGVSGAEGEAGGIFRERDAAVSIMGLFFLICWFPRCFLHEHYRPMRNPSASMFVFWKVRRPISMIGENAYRFYSAPLGSVIPQSPAPQGGFSCPSGQFTFWESPAP